MKTKTAKGKRPAQAGLKEPSVENNLALIQMLLKAVEAGLDIPAGMDAATYTDQVSRGISQAKALAVMRAEDPTELMMLSHGILRGAAKALKAGYFQLAISQIASVVHFHSLTMHRMHVEKRKRIAKRGGATAAKTARARAATWRADAQAAARSMLATGTPKHNISGILAKRFRKSPRVVRDVLKIARVI